MDLSDITEDKKSLLENMFDYADSNSGRVPDYIFNQMCGELNLDPDIELENVFNCTDRKWDRYTTGFFTILS